MIDIEKQVDYWRRGAEEDMAVAKELLEKNRTSHCLFFIHLSLEKMLQAHVCRHTQDLAPRTHGLLRLAELASLDVNPEMSVDLDRIDDYNIEGRYPRTDLDTTTSRLDISSGRVDQGRGDNPMASQSIIEIIHRYLLALEGQGIQVSFGVLFGSYATGRADKWSDIDLIVVSRSFDPKATWDHLRTLSSISRTIDLRIEPIPCGERQWVEDDERAIIEIARREGQRVDLVRAA